MNTKLRRVRHGLGGRRDLRLHKHRPRGQSPRNNVDRRKRISKSINQAGLVSVDSMTIDLIMKRNRAYNDDSKRQCSLATKVVNDLPLGAVVVQRVA